ncbi:uncharacterized protein (TIGR02145 family) [Prolixibacter denitrificans]|uniref:Uncharacterized protein (TIGR02145 family) n=2 Tax=Prolixibacter denitrificans TaxID=1541063 RepID=A0A2P8CL83_9BACT|nr:uncharacterized protein (TIGR02145 family) [Prolixibacter denitrificans]GET20339.1 hypothetical protein JCM18694_05850 [Prolixibacter denitrificans]
MLKNFTFTKMEKKIQIRRKGFMGRIIPIVLIAVLFSVTFQSCQKDESILNAAPGGQLKSASISTVSQSSSISTVLITNLISKINGYVTKGELQSGIANALVSKLKNVIKSVDKGNEKPAMNQLQAVINQVDGLVGSDTIDTTIGNGIIFDIRALAGENPTYTDPRDGKVYKTIKIGDQIWMAENLAYLPSVNSLILSGTKPYYYVNGYWGTNTADAKATDNYKTYGVLYNWPAAKTASPEGWHLPSDAEWTQLANYLIDNGYGVYKDIYIAKALAATTSWWGSRINATIGYDLSSNNSSGFTALPGGGLLGHALIRPGQAGFWWSATESTASTAWSRTLRYVKATLIRSTQDEYKDKWMGFSVRCIRN